MGKHQCKLDSISRDVTCGRRCWEVKPVVPQGMTLPEMALRFILSNPDVSTIIPGMRQLKHVESNMRTADGAGLAPELLDELKQHRWERTPTSWSQ